MTIGEIIFYSGLGLMVITAILAVIFWFVKPQYKPENTTYEGGSPGTQRLRSGYPTDRLTVRQDPPTPASARFTGTAAVPPQVAAAVPPQPGTVPLRNAAAPTEKTAPTPGTVPLMNDGTAVLQGTAQAAGTAAPKATAPLEASAPAPAPTPNGRQEDQGGTTLL